LATAILGSSIAFIEGSVANLALPAIQADLGIDAVELQWVVNVYLLVLGAFTLVGGSLGDRFGLRRIFILGNAVFALGALGCAAASSLSALIVARLVQGLGGALLVPTSLALIGTHFDEDERGRAIGTWAGASALTTAIGPVLGGWLVDQWDWPAVFLLVAPLAALTIAVAWWRVPVTPTADDGALDYLGALFLVGSLGLLILAVVDPGSTPQRAAMLFVAAALGAAFFWRELRFDTPILPLRLFRSRSFSGANAMTLLLYAALSGALYFLPFNLIQVHGYTATQAGAAFLPMTLLLGVGSTLAGDSIRKFDPRFLLTLGPFVTAIGFFALAAPGENASYVGGFLPGILILGIGMTLSVAPLTTVVMSSVSGRQTGIASGINNTVARLAGVLAVGTLTAVAIASFSGTLETRLQEAGVSGALIAKVSSGAAQLAELKPPANVNASITRAIQGSVTSAYITTFRSIIVICGMLAVFSGLIAWFSLGRRRT
jgi:EmrB/QacA subfamily drug resistance transporter